MFGSTYSEEHSTPLHLPSTELVTLPLSPPSLPSTPSVHPSPPTPTQPSIPSLPSHTVSSHFFCSTDCPSPSLHPPFPSSLNTISASASFSSVHPCSSCSSLSSFLSPPLSSSPSSSPSIFSIPETDHISFAFSSFTHSSSASSSSSPLHSSWSFSLTPTTSPSMLNSLANELPLDDLFPIQEQTSFLSVIDQVNPQKQYIQTLKHRLYNNFGKIAEKVDLHSKLNTPEYLEMAKAADTIVFLLHQSIN